MKLFINRPMKKPLSLGEILSILQYARDFKKHITIHITHKLVKKVVVETVITNQIDVCLVLLDEYLKNDLKSISREMERVAYKLVDYNDGKGDKELLTLKHDGLHRITRALRGYLKE